MASAETPGSSTQTLGNITSQSTHVKSHPAHASDTTPCFTSCFTEEDLQLDIRDVSSEEETREGGRLNRAQQPLQQDLSCARPHEIVKHKDKLVSEWFKDKLVSEWFKDELVSDWFKDKLVSEWFKDELVSDWFKDKLVSEWFKDELVSDWFEYKLVSEWFKDELVWEWFKDELVSDWFKDELVSDWFKDKLVSEWFKDELVSDWFKDKLVSEWFKDELVSDWFEYKLVSEWFKDELVSEWFKDELVSEWFKDELVSEWFKDELVSEWFKDELVSEWFKDELVSEWFKDELVSDWFKDKLVSEWFKDKLVSEWFKDKLVWEWFKDELVSDWFKDDLQVMNLLTDFILCQSQETPRAETQSRELSITYLQHMVRAAAADVENKTRTHHPNSSSSVPIDFSSRIMIHKIISTAGVRRSCISHLEKNQEQRSKRRKNEGDEEWKIYGALRLLCGTGAIASRPKEATSFQARVPAAPWSLLPKSSTAAEYQLTPLTFPRQPCVHRSLGTEKASPPPSHWSLCPPRLRAAPPSHPSVFMSQPPKQETLKEVRDKFCLRCPADSRCALFNRVMRTTASEHDTRSRSHRSLFLQRLKDSESHDVCDAADQITQSALGARPRWVTLSPGRLLPGRIRPVLELLLSIADKITFKIRMQKPPPSESGHAY
ncbi:unnamed protein product [Pleuronectes platessa]|uniref:Uncharacterized protein n=1 Tax=Pleuronectes platessa TaxID=8262 RepID=A0A9N7YLY4_PLEPL|nr:unnamed protein product [Pleuronectes platessa]